MPVLNPEHLLEQADRLIAPIGGGAPRQADLRRAISTAYYGIFHAVVTSAADDLVGRTHRETPRYALVYRSVAHRGLRGLCEDIIKPTLPAKYRKHEPRGGFGSEITALATAVVDLHEKRHSADYAPLFRARMSDAVFALATARTALARLRSATASRRKAFLALVLFSPR